MVKPASFSGLPKHQGTTVLESTITNTRISKSTLVVTLRTKMASLSSRKVSKFRDTPPKYISHAQQCFLSVAKPETREKRVKSNCCGSIAFGVLVYLLVEQFAVHKVARIWVLWVLSLQRKRLDSSFIELISSEYKATLTDN